VTAEDERRVFRLLSVFPAPFTLEAAEAVAGPAATVLRLVDCSLLVPPRPGPDGRTRYAMLETLRGYGAGLQAQAEERDAEAALARYALRVAEQAAAGLTSIAGESAAARWLDAEDATMRHVLAWAVGHDLDTAARLVTALEEWWVLRGRLAGQQPLLHELAGRAEPGSAAWCAAQLRLAWITFDAADLRGALQRCAAIGGAIGEREPSPVLADCLALQSITLSNLGRVPEAAGCARRALAIARELGYPPGQVLATNGLAITAAYAGDPVQAVRLTRQGAQIPGIPRVSARVCGYLLAGALAETGDLAAAEEAGADTVAQARDAGDLYVLGGILPVMADLALKAGRPDDAAAHLREAAEIALQTGAWIVVLNVLEGCGYLSVATGHPADAITAWAACAALGEQGDPDMHRLEEAAGQARQKLGPDRARAAEQRGAAMSLATAAEYALLLATPDPPPAQAASQAGRLSARERELVTLVAQGRTDADIAAQLFISIRTVRSHLDRIRDKTGCRRRADLTRLALAEGLV